MKHQARELTVCCLLFVVFSCGSWSVEAASVIRVPTEQPTIQGAISVASDGDIVQVAPGTYEENLNFLGKAIRVTSEQGPGVTIIDGNGVGPVVMFVTSESRQATLNGFTIRNGANSGSADGGGIRIVDSSPTITGNIITDNSAGDGGGGIAIYFSSPLIQGNVIKNNGQMLAFSGGVGGGGIMILGPSSAQILNNNISNNSWRSADGGGLSLIGAGTPTIQNNVVSNNNAYGDGGGFYIVGDSNASIVQNLIVGNTAAIGAGVYWVMPSGTRGPFLINNTIYANSSPQGSGVFADSFDGQPELINNIIVASAGQTAVMCSNFSRSTPIFLNNDVVAASGLPYGGICTNQTGLNGNISADPLFVNPAAGDYRLQSGSPAIDGGTDGGTTADLSGVSRPMDGDGDGIAVIDIGAFEAPTLDSTNPVTVATLSPLPSAANWNMRDVTVTLSATDIAGGTGIQSISYSLTGAQNSPVMTTANPAVVGINAEGVTTLSYSATDRAGKAEPAKSLTIKVDRTAPTTVAAATPAAGAAGWNNSPVTVALTATDPASGSGVQDINYSMTNYLLTGNQVGSTVIAGNPASVLATAEGITTLVYAAADQAGNLESYKSMLIKIDYTGPTVSGMPAPGCTLSPAKHQMVQVASITAEDTLSGLASLNITASSNEPDSGTGGGDVPGDIVINGGIVLLRAERTPSGNGRIYTIVATATDLVGNKTTVTATCTVPKDIDSGKS